MLSIERTHVAVVACHATPQALDALQVTEGAFACRVAPDELLLVAPPVLLAETEREVAAHFAAVEPTALVLDQSDGWSAFTFRGGGADSIFAQLSALPLPVERPAFLQGAVAGGSAKILLVDGGIHVLVPSTLRDYFASRLRDVCGSLAVVPATETAFVSERPGPSFHPGAATPAVR